MLPIISAATWPIPENSSNDKSWLTSLSSTSANQKPKKYTASKIFSTNNCKECWTFFELLIIIKMKRKNRICTLNKWSACASWPLEARNISSSCNLVLKILNDKSWWHSNVEFSFWHNSDVINLSNEKFIQNLIKQFRLLQLAIARKIDTVEGRA